MNDLSPSVFFFGDGEASQIVAFLLQISEVN